MKKTLLCLLYLQLLLASGAFGQTKQNANKLDAAGPVVEMEPYVVKADRVLPAPEQWLYVKVPVLVLMRGKRNIVAPGYEMLSNLNFSQTKSLVENLQLRQFAATYLWPMLTQALPKMPVYVVVDINQQQSTFRPVVRKIDSWEGDPIVLDEAAPSSGNPDDFYDHAASASQSFAAEYGLGEVEDINPEMTPQEETENEIAEMAQNAIKGNRDDTDLNAVRPLPDGFVDLAANGGPLAALVRAGEPRASTVRPSEEQLAATLSYALNLHALKSLPRKPPPWFARGISSLLGATQVSHTQIRFAMVKENLSRQNMPGLAELFKKDDVFSLEEARLAAIFVHFGLYGDNGKYAARFMQFVDRIERGEQPTAQMFEEVFGFKISRMENDLATYSRTFAFFKSTDIKGAIPEMPACTFREATQSEVARIKSEIYISQINAVKALDELRTAYWRGEREPAMLAALASVELRIGSESRARKITKALLELPVPPAQAYIVGARLQLKDILAAKSDGAKLNATETSGLIDTLGGALVGGLTTEELCSVLAEIVLKSETVANAGISAFLREAAKRYPLNKTIAEALKPCAGLNSRQQNNNP
ncbi:hypothetical protein OH491_01370 [Termitidicoccus mucosus]|uniref:Uncharacterized protein n=1 Tax=Termitidicoccus mucosus TaxID=1184151 RepID=A0A178IKM6_9BACT|nr:hypothetical protein AW736_08175 [Opitutaceae bacterium TSB47]